MIREFLRRLTTVQPRTHNAMPVPDDVLAAHIRSKLAKIVRNPRAIEVTVEQGHVLLHGPILMREVDKIIDPISRMPGVTRVENQWEIYDELDGDFPALSGGKRDTRERRAG